MERCFVLADRAAIKGENRVGAILTDQEGNLIAEASERKLSDVVAELDLVTTILATSEKLPLTRLAKLDFICHSERLFIVDLSTL